MRKILLSPAVIVGVVAFATLMVVVWPHGPGPLPQTHLDDDAPITAEPHVRPASRSHGQEIIEHYRRKMPDLLVLDMLSRKLGHPRGCSGGATGTKLLEHQA